MSTTRIVTCLRCGQARPYKARSLCNPCDFAARRDGTIADYPLGYRRADDVLDDYRLLHRGEGHTVRQVADRLGMDIRALRRALQRARARGDARAAA